MGVNLDKYVFVFGSNLAGIHGGGAARYAREYKGAQMGVGEGRTGQSYALPTKGISPTGGVGNTLPLDVIQDAVDRFIAHATERPYIQFQVTCIGCGLAGLKHEHVAPMFENAPGNCWFDII